MTCQGSVFGNCCSPAGWCGSTAAYCGDGCQSGFGSCGDASSAAVGAVQATTNTAATFATSKVATTTSARPTQTTTAAKATATNGSRLQVSCHILLKWELYTNDSLDMAQQLVQQVEIWIQLGT